MLQIHIPVESLLAFLVVFTRVALILVFFPFFGDDFCPRKVKAVVAAGITIPLLLATDYSSIAVPTTLGRWALMMLPEVALALTIGFCGRLVFEGIRAGGSLVGHEMGFMTANVIDPSNNSEISIVAQIWQVTAVIIFFGLNGHYVVIQAIAESLRTIPPFQMIISPDLFTLIHHLTVEMFATAVRISAPVVVAMVLTNVCLALVNKVVPQMHVFMESFPLRILLGLWMLTVLSGVMVVTFEKLLGDLGDYIWTALRLVTP